MALAYPHFLGADLSGDGVCHIALHSEGQIQQALVSGNSHGVPRGADRNITAVRRGLHTGNLAVQQFAGGHQGGGDIVGLDALINCRLDTLHQHGIFHMMLGGAAARDAAAARLEELHAQNHRRNNDHQDHQQIHDVDFAKQSSLFIYHLLQPPRL